jgi:diguanylate cyclase (GGDEF)-like protein
VELRDHDLLANVQPETIGHIRETATAMTLEPGELLINSGTSPRTLYFLLEGELAVHLQGLDRPPVAVLGPGQAVGEMSIILGTASSADVRATSACRVVAIDHDRFWRIVDASHPFAINMLNLLARRMSASNTKMREQQQEKERAERDAMADGLTGVHNRRWLDDRMPRFIARHRHDNEPFAAMLLDVDHFKKFNDTYGHAVGDAVLRSVAAVAVSVLRPTDAVARYGGEEFVILLPETDLDGARLAAERVRMRIAATPVEATPGQVVPPVNVSIGVVVLDASETGAEMLKRADALLYQAKHNGRNRVEG